MVNVCSLFQAWTTTLLIKSWTSPRLYKQMKWWRVRRSNVLDNTIHFTAETLQKILKALSSMIELFKDEHHFEAIKTSLKQSIWYLHKHLLNQVHTHTHTHTHTLSLSLFWSLTDADICFRQMKQLVGLAQPASTKAAFYIKFFDCLCLILRVRAYVSVGRQQ